VKQMESKLEILLNKLIPKTMITAIITWLVDIISKLGYPGVGLAMFIESFFAPIPSELVLPFSGFVVSQGTLNLYLTIIVATISAYLGTLPFYFIGKWGQGMVDKFLRKFGKFLFIYPEDVDMGYKAFNQYGNGIVFLGRLIPIIRTVISLPAGVSKMNFFIFSVYTLLGSLVWSSILIIAGYALGENWSVVGGYVSKYEKIIIALIIILIILFIARGIYKIIKTKKLSDSK
jgi:membrane protein DedA with SNARE-associated domain